MPPLNVTDIDKKLGVTAPIPTIPPSNPMVSQIENITNNVKFILEMVMKSKKQPAPQTKEEPHTLTYDKMNNPEMKIPKINATKLNDALLQKLSVSDFLPETVTKKSIGDFLTEFKTNKATQDLIVKGIMKLVEKCYD